MKTGTKHALPLIIGISIIAVGAFGLLSATHEKNKKIERLTKVTKATASAGVERTEVKIKAATSWVITHSAKISEETARHIATEALRYPNPVLMLAVIEAESEFTPTAISKAGAIGLGQIMYEVHKKDLVALDIKKKRELFDIDKNIRATSFVLQMMLKKDGGNVEKALHSYLGGKDGKYVARIFSNYVHLSMEIESEMSSRKL